MTLNCKFLFALFLIILTESLRWLKQPVCFVWIPFTEENVCWKCSGSCEKCTSFSICTECPEGTRWRSFSSISRWNFQFKRDTFKDYTWAILSASVRCLLFSVKYLLFFLLFPLAWWETNAKRAVTLEPSIMNTGIPVNHATQLVPHAQVLTTIYTLNIT